MFCTKCGKLTFGESTLCNDCLAVKASTTQQSDATAAPKAAPAQQNPAAPAAAPTPSANSNPYAYTPAQEPVTPPQQQYTAPTSGGYYGSYGQSEFNSNGFNSDLNFGSLENTNSKLGFGGALTSTILGYLGYIFVSFWFGFGMAMPAVGIIGALVTSLPMFIVALVLGTKAIKCFKNTVGKKPVITLVFGIIGVVFAAITAFMIFLTFLTPAISDSFLSEILGDDFFFDMYDF